MSADYLNVDQLIEKLISLKEQLGSNDEPVYYYDSSGYNYYVMGVFIDRDGTIVIE